MSSSRPQADCTAHGPYGALMEITRRPPITFTRGQGGRLWDSDGNRYLDFVQGWAVNCLGHAPPALTRVLAEQSDQAADLQPRLLQRADDTLRGRLDGRRGAGPGLLRQQRRGGQ